MKIFNLLIITISFLSLPALAELTQDDLTIFSALHSETMSSGTFRVLNRSTVVGDTEQIPFQQRIKEIANALVATGMSPQAAQSTAVLIFLEELERKGSSVAIEKSKFRAGENKVDLSNGMTKTLGRDFCHPVTGECVSGQDPSLLGKRPSRGQVPYFFPEEFEKKLTGLDNSASLLGQEQPWSDDYWAIKKGILGHRYADGNAHQSSWEEAAQYVLEEKNHLLSILDLPAGEQKDRIIANLSPGEKYDLLIGNIDEDQYESWFDYLEDPNYAAGMSLFGVVGGYLTPNHWSQGQAYYDDKGEVEDWMGICHGWATAAIHMDRPVKGVVAKAFDGKTDIKFYPADIKALGSLLWAESAPRSRFIGGRCNDKEVEEDPDSGAIIAENCFDTNPGDWHVVISNYLGKMKQSFIMDATFDYAVWNQPVLSYDLVFFHPATGERSYNFEKVKMDWSDYEQKDPFKKVREEELRRKYIVGVDMKVQYLAETRPNHNWSDSFHSDRLLTAYYTYDLELDEDFNVIGGEWYNNTHPDFLWVHDKDSKAVSRYEQFYAANIDQILDDNYEDGILTLDQAVAEDLTAYAKAGAVRGEVMAFIVEALFREAQ